MKKLKAFLLMFSILLASFGLQVTVQSQEAYEPVFSSGMDLLFIRDNTTPYGQALLDTSSWENHGFPYPQNDPYDGPALTWGKYGYALDFDGSDDSINVTDDDSLDGMDELTIMAWIYLEGEGADPDQDVFYKESSYFFRIEANDRWAFRVFNGSTYNQTLSTIGVMSIGTWVHLAGVYNGTHIYMYADGERNGNATSLTGSVRQTTSNLMIGGLPQYDANFVNGIIDEVRIYPVALDQDHIQHDMATPINKFEQYWFVQSYNNVNGWSEDFFDATYVKFNDNDPDLPYTKSDSTYGHVELESIRYIPSFQSYRYYCTIHFQSADTTLSSEYAQWEFIMFRNGIATTRFLINVSRDRDITVSPDDHFLVVQFKQYYNNQWNLEQEDTITYAVTDNPIRYYDIIVDAWVGVDRHHFTTRVSVDAENKSGTLKNIDQFGQGVHAQPKYSATHGFQLLDSSGNTHILDWYDGWFINILRFVNQHYEIEGSSSYFEVSEHGILLAITVIAFWIIAGASIYQYVVRPYVKETFGFSLPSIPVMGEEPSDLVHGLLGIISAALKPILDALSPIFNAISNVGRFIIQAVLDMGTAVANTIISALDSLGSVLGLGDNAFSNFLSSIVQMATTFTELVSQIPQALANFANMLVTVLANTATAITSFLTFVAWSLTWIPSLILDTMNGVGGFLNGTGYFDALPDGWGFTVIKLWFLLGLPILLVTKGVGWLWDMILKVLAMFKIIIDISATLIHYIIKFGSWVIQTLRSLWPL